MSEDKSSALYDDIVTVNSVDPALYDMYPVKRGLRNNDGSGVIAGITNISNVHGYMMNEGDKVPVEGKLTFRGYDIYDLLSDTSPSKRYGFEEVAYLLMLGKLPTPVRGCYRCRARTARWLHGRTYHAPSCSGLDDHAVAFDHLALCRRPQRRRSFHRA